MLILFIHSCAAKKVFFEAVTPRSHIVGHKSLKTLLSKKNGKDFPVPFILDCSHDSKKEVADVLEKNKNGVKGDHIKTDGAKCKKIKKAGGDCAENGSVIIPGTGEGLAAAEVHGEFQISSKWAKEKGDACTMSVDARDTGSGAGLHVSALFRCDWTQNNAVACNYKGDENFFDRFVECYCTFVTEDDEGDPDTKCDCPGTCLLDICLCDPGRSGKLCGLDAQWSRFSECACEGDEEVRECVEGEPERGGKPCPLEGVTSRKCQNTTGLKPCSKNTLGILEELPEIPEPSWTTMTQMLIIIGGTLYGLGALVLLYTFFCTKEERRKDTPASGRF